MDSRTVLKTLSIFLKSCSSAYLATYIKNEPSIATLRTGNLVAYQVIYERYRDAFITFANTYDIDRDTILDVYQKNIPALCENVMKIQSKHKSCIALNNLK
ncbi:MAG: hypothetical protein ACI9Y7_002442 [Dokdonia sp.]|jgi:hypothetical protein